MKKIIVFLIAVSMLFAVSCNLRGVNKPKIPQKDDGQEVVNTPAKDKITLYYTDSDASGLYAEVREVDSSKSEDAAFIAEELLKGSTNKELINAIPEGTRLNSCTVKDGLCTVDLSAEFISKNGTANEHLSIYSVVNTLCLLDSVSEVRFLIDGKEVMIYGSYIFDEPFSADSTIIK